MGEDYNIQPVSGLTIVSLEAGFFIAKRGNK
jgi:hypothetical protein